jgi:DnaJ-class molecular chaperone
MYDFSIPNAKPGRCEKCRGSGLYCWGVVVNGKASKSGPCHSCKGTGRQTAADICRNVAYNRYKISTLASV